MLTFGGDIMMYMLTVFTTFVPIKCYEITDPIKSSGIPDPTTFCSTSIFYIMMRPEGEASDIGV